MGVVGSCMFEVYDHVDYAVVRIRGYRDCGVSRLMYPVYYVDKPITLEEIAKAQSSWETITQSTSSEFENQHNWDPNFPFRTCEEWFQTAFYERFFDVHPISRPMFKDPKKQGRFLTNFFTFLFSCLGNSAKFEAYLIRLAEGHAKKGIKSCEYGVLGQVMFWSLSLVLGREYTLDIHNVWVKIFSAMLKVIVPVSISFELKSNASQLKRISEFEEYCVSKCKVSKRAVPQKSLSSMISTKSFLGYSQVPTVACSEDPISTSNNLQDVDLGLDDVEETGDL